jgi:CubicO group peptidase (beta-lactamase class C family)
MICENKNMKIMKKVFLLNMIAMFGFLLSYCQQANDSTEQKMFKQKKLSQEEYLEYRSEKININNPDVQSKINALDCYFSKRVDSLGFNGAVMVVYRGTPILEGYYGYSNFSNKTKLNKRSSFQIASTTKTFTSGAILMLHQEGYLKY